MKKAIYLLTIFLQVMHLANAQETSLKPRIDHAVYFDISPPLRDMARLLPEQYDGSWKEAAVINYFDLNGDQHQKGLAGLVDPGLQDFNGSVLSDTTIQNFDGMGNASGSVPPDTHGEAGLNHFFQTVNCSYSIYTKSGVKILGPLANSSVWYGMPNNANSGDAIILYDEQANRWLFSQFSLPNGSSTAPFYQMIAVSQTSDPTGSWYRYQYEFNEMPDYPKFGVWPDAYYMSANLFTGGWVGNGAYGYDRAAMLNGNPDATRVSFTMPGGSEGFISLLPADCDGTFPPLGTPNFFTYIRTDGTQRLGVIEFHVDWGTPSSSTFGNTLYLNVNPFASLGWGSGIPQKGSPQLLETLGDRLMYRLQYRKFNSYSSMVLNHSVNAGSGIAGIRWYELRNTGTVWSIYQQATYAPSDGNSRWMGSIAQDTAGTISVGYSVSSANIYPGIRYTGRFKTDPLNQMTIAEKTIINGGGSQTGIWSGRSRWGDYSGMSVDPSNPTTFWYTTEYYATTSSSTWQTRIASFSFDNVFSSSASAAPARFCSSNPDSSQLNALAYGGSGTYTYAWSSIPAGFNSTLKSPKVRPQQTTKYIAAISDGILTRHDTTEVSIIMAPVATAGNDTTVCWYVSPIPLYATATNYGKVTWGTAGDGHFSDATSLTSSYSPGIHDKTSGSVDLRLMVTPIAPCAANLLLAKHIVLDACTGTEEPAAPTVRVTIQPNPAHGNVVISIHGLNAKATLSIRGSDGQTVYSSNVDPGGKQDFNLQLDVTNYAPGMYILQMNGENFTTAARFIVQ